MTSTAQGERMSLYYQAGSSDKEYHTSIEPSGGASGGFVVNFAYGRRGSTLQTGTKTPDPVDYATAKKVYDKLVASKTAKGYTPGEEGTPYEHTDKEARATGILPQLLNPIDESEAERLLADPAWLIQEKLDGKRVLLQRIGDTITGINRTGLAISLPQPVVACALKIGHAPWLLDGECIGDTLVVFDLLERAGVDMRNQPYRRRIDTLYCMPGIGPGEPIQFVRTRTKTAEKRALLAELRGRKAEGVVFKRIDAPYTPGRPASGGDQLKLKFTATASCIVAGSNGTKRSVALELLGPSGSRVRVGNVTIPANQPIPATGSIADVKYLYAYEGGSLFQPVFLGVRDDLDISACTTRQLKLKPTEAGEEADQDSEA